MPTATYIALANTTLTSATGTVTFSSIPATYRDLVIIANVPSLSGNVTTRDGYLTLNGSGGTSVYMYGAGSGSGVSATSSDIHLPFDNRHGVYIVNIMDYSATDKHKTILTRTGTGQNATFAIAGRWASTNAVTSVGLVSPDSATKTFAIGSTFALYGIVS